MADPTVDYSVSPRVTFEFTNDSSCDGEFCRERTCEELMKAFSVFDGHEQYNGTYTVLVGPLYDQPLRSGQGDFFWMAHTEGQRGIGFVFGGMSKLKQVLPHRRFSLKPPPHLDVEEVCQILHRKVIPFRNLLTSPAPVPAVPASLVPSGTEALAIALQKAKEHQARLEASLSNRTVLEQQIALAEQELANQPTLDDLVMERLKSLGLG